MMGDEVPWRHKRILLAFVYLYAAHTKIPTAHETQSQYGLR